MNKNIDNIFILIYYINIGGTYHTTSDEIHGIWEVDMKQIDKASRIPLYSQLMDIIIEEIETSMHEDDQLPSERDICEKYDVSRSTVRQAITELEREGYIYKVHGKGTFVASKKLDQDLVKFYSFTEEMKKLGKKPVSKVLMFEIVGISNKISKKMRMEEGTLAYKFTRLRIADNIPMIVETSYVPYDKFPGITKENLEKEALYDILKNKFQVNITMAEETFQPVLTNEEEAERLEISKESPSLKIERFTYENDDIIEYTISIARGDKFKYRVRLEK